ncbi:hypothetical protein IVB27_28630 [Bradyrhizobium sp. 197]|jgi:hypothetical protein|uniref:hypothetical protein n=1 Tax=Bradyrhizobium sp. 197 TaxID=2782663 RepID=UPI001FF7EFDD|nr:hypothetical protein [Bradyrhizobium sp. 197]MCK1478607.1 hypothetical protein [Bradyrhizobium sp. 197]
MTDRPHLTKEELELLATPSSELATKHFVFSFDRPKFEGRISTGERWQQLLQAHLYYDHVVTQILLDALPNPEAVNLRRMGFAQKLQLISAMALLPEELIAPIESINGLRNKIAHALDFEIQDSALTDLANCTPKKLRGIAETEDGRPAGPLLFHELLRIVLLQCEVYRQRSQLNRAEERKSMLRLRAVLDRANIPMAD